LKRVSFLQGNAHKLQQAFVYQHSISKLDYDEMRAKLVEDLTLAEMELRDAQAEQIEVEAVLDFAEIILLFPGGLTYSDGNYRTAVTSLLFPGMQMRSAKKEGLVALPGIEPGFED
jgi:hypothetical protein